MALTVSRLINDNLGTLRMVRGDIAFGSSYPSGGESLTPLTVGLSTIDTMNVLSKSGYTFDWNSVNKKLLAYSSGPTMYNYSPGGGDIKGSANTDSENADTATKPTNGDRIDTLHAVTTTTLTSISNASPAVFTKAAHGLSVGHVIVLTTSGVLPAGLALATHYYVISAGFTSGVFQVSATAAGAAINTTDAGSGTHSYQSWKYSEDLEMDIPRNVLILIANDTAGSLNLYEGAMIFTVTGTFRGVAQTETITFTSTAGNKAVANTPAYRVKYGVKPFGRITDIVADHLPDLTMKIGAGVGSLIGYPIDSLTGADADFTKLVKTGVDLAVATLVDYTNKTVNFGTLADGDDIFMTYWAAGQVSSGTDLSSLTGVRFEARGV